VPLIFFRFQAGTAAVVMYDNILRVNRLPLETGKYIIKRFPNLSLIKMMQISIQLDCEQHFTCIPTTIVTI